MFAGQGSQFFGMGNLLYNDNKYFKKYVDIVDDKIIEICGKSIKSRMLNSNRRSKEKFDDFLESSFSIFMFEYSAAMMMADEGVKPDAVIGCSLGELAAQTIAGAMNLDEALMLIYRQSLLFTEENKECCMLAVGAHYEKDVDISKYKDSEIISVSHEKQFVVSGSSSDIRRLEQDLHRQHVMYIKLPVNYPFHTHLMERIEAKYKTLLEECGFGRRKCYRKMYSCVTGGEISQIDDNYRWEILRKKIQWQECIRKLKQKDTILIDLSPDGELAVSLKYTFPEHKEVYKVSTMFQTKIDIAEIVHKIKDKGDNHLKAFVFPGQGSQFKGMGGDLFDEFSDLVEIADRVLGYSIKDLCLNDPENVLNNTKYTQPALFTVCALGYLKKIKDGESKPDFVAGHSIGEYAALFAAGVVDFETGIKLVKKRAELMAKANGGTMAAVVGLDKEKVEQILKENHLERIDVANLNTPSQIVISGIKDDIVGAEQYFKAVEGCLMYKILNVSAAFHSRYMEPARDEFTDYLKQFHYNKMEIPVIANITARVYKENEVADTLSKQLVSSVQWTDSVRYMMAKGVDTFEEIGPGHVAIGMVRKIQRQAEPLDLSNEKEEQDNNLTALENGKICINASKLGNRQLIEDYHLKYAYMAGSMCKGISGVKMLEAAGRAGILAFAGTQKMEYEEIESMIQEIQSILTKKESYGFNLTYDILDTARERNLCELYLKYGVHIMEASAYSTITKPLVKYCLTGIKKDESGNIQVKNHIIAKVSRSEIAECFMSPAPKRIVDALLKDGEITKEEAELSQLIPMSYDICVEADCGGYTDCGNIFSVLPAIKSLSQNIMKKYPYKKKIRVGVAGGIGTAQSAAAAFMMGADFIMTGSINQCTVEADTSDMAKEMMSTINVQDTDYIHAWEEYESTGKVQVMKHGTLFKVRADKLYHIYQNALSLGAIDEKTKEQIETRYFKKSFDEVLKEAKKQNKEENEYFDEEAKSKAELRQIFKWYYTQSLLWAIEGDAEHQSDFQIMCGPALGAFNQWVKGTELENWKNRTIVGIADKIMNSAADYQQEYVSNFLAE